MILRGKSDETAVIREEGGAGLSLAELLSELSQEMEEASAALEFERAALLRDQIMELKAGTGLEKISPTRRSVTYGSKKRRR